VTTGSGGSEMGQGMEQLIGKAIAEPDFRQQVIENPEEAVRNAGIELSAEEMEALTGSSREEREQIMQALAERMSPICLWCTSGSSGGISCFWISGGL